MLCLVCRLCEEGRDRERWGPLAARIVGIANRRMCDIHCHKVQLHSMPMPLPSEPSFEVAPACSSAYIQPALDCSN